MTTAVLLTIGAIGILFVLSAFFSGSETALTAASRARMHQEAKSGNRRAQLVNKLRDNPERLIGAILTGNTLVNILASALATSLLVQTYGEETGVALATIVMTLGLLVFSETLPKTFAFSHADRMALAVAPVLRAVVFALTPLIRVINAIVNGILSALGAKVVRRIGAITEQELRGAIDLHRAEDTTVQVERRMMQSILDLEDVEIADVMTYRTDVTMIDLDLPKRHIVDLACQSRYTRIPLWRGEPDNIVGILHVRALMNELWAKNGDADAVDLAALAGKPWFVPETATLFDQMQAFRARREHFAVVVDEYGGYRGIVTLEDILEEIVGDIIDEYDVATATVRPQGDGNYVVAGRTTIRDLNRQFEWNLPDEEASTVAGLVLHEAREIPELGKIYRFFGFEFEALRRRHNQITALRIRKLPENDEPGRDEDG